MPSVRPHAAAALLLSLLLPRPAPAGALESELLAVQHDWEVIRYQTPAFERERRYEALAARAHALSEAHPERSEALVWEGVVIGSWADERGGLGALRLARQAKARYEAALRLDARVLDGTALSNLGVLYAKAPGWPFGFGDKDKARELLLQALQMSPDGIDANASYGEFLIETGHPAEAVAYLEKALAAAPRPGHQVADTGRLQEARAALERLRAPR